MDAEQIATVWNVLVADTSFPISSLTISSDDFEHKEDLTRARKPRVEYKYKTNGAAVIPYHPGAKKYFAEKGVKLN